MTAGSPEYHDFAALSLCQEWLLPPYAGNSARAAAGEDRAGVHAVLAAEVGDIAGLPELVGAERDDSLAGTAPSQE